MKMSLLFVEDKPDSIANAKKKVEEQHPDVQCKVMMSFDEAIEYIRNQTPDIVSLDLIAYDLSGDREVAGQEVYDIIWQERFCPIIVYSAEPYALSEIQPNPFVKIIKKGRGSPQRFAKAIAEFRPHVKALREAEAIVRREFAIALREVASYSFNVFSEPEERDNAILRSGRRRLAALMDDFSRHGPQECLASWEQYVSPPVTQNLQLADILRKEGGSVDDPSAFSVVLSPSCDLVATGGRIPKIKNVLVARCHFIKSALSQAGIDLKKNPSNKLKIREDSRKSLKRTILTQGFYSNIVPFPAFKGRIPTMAADLRDLQFIPVEDIGLSEKPYLRIASIDSPFRELLSWAYLQTACRPGLPDRDWDSWGDEIISSCQDDGNSTG